MERTRPKITQTGQCMTRFSNATYLIPMPQFFYCGVLFLYKGRQHAVHDSPALGMVQRDNNCQSLGSMHRGIDQIGRLKLIYYANCSWSHNQKAMDLIHELRSLLSNLCCCLLVESKIYLSHYFHLVFSNLNNCK